MMDNELIEFSNRIKEIDIFLKRQDYKEAKNYILKIQIDLIAFISGLGAFLEDNPESLSGNNAELLEILKSLDNDFEDVFNDLNDVTKKYNQNARKKVNFALSKVIDCAFRQVKEILKSKFIITPFRCDRLQ